MTSITRTLHATLMAMVACAVMLLQAAPAQAAVTGTVTNPDGINVRQGPSTYHDVIGGRAYGEKVSISCKTFGTTHGPTRYWYKIGTRKYVSASNVAGGASAPICSESRVDNYPYRGTCSPSGSGDDPGGWSKGQCTSFAAWRVRDRLGISTFNQTWKDSDAPSGSVVWGAAKNWNNTAPKAGVRTGTIPMVGSIAVSENGTNGHVAYVTKVNSDGTFVIEEYNWSRCAYTTRTTRVGPNSDQFSSFVYL